MKVAIIILGNSWVCPYVNIYKRMFDKAGCGCDIILWDRDGSDAGAANAFRSGAAAPLNPFSKAVGYLRYARFIKKTVIAKGYDRLVVSGPHLAILLSSFLRKRYAGKYILDYRDIAVEQHPLLRGRYSKALAASYCNVISSPGFKEFLPAGKHYFLSHNFSYEAALASLSAANPPFSNRFPVKILTIGSIRNFSSNVRLLDSLGNNSRYAMQFTGRGEAAAELQEYAVSHSIANASFSGFYNKADEASIVAGCTFINILFPSDKQHSPIMSNRFYLALIYKKPVIVTAGSTQAGYVREFGLGIVVDDTRNLDRQLSGFLSGFNYSVFCARCNELLARFAGDHRSLERTVAGFLE